MSTNAKGQKRSSAAPATTQAAAPEAPNPPTEAEKGAASESGGSEAGAAVQLASSNAQAEAPQGRGAAATRLTSYGKRKTTIMARASGAVDSVAIGEGNGHERIFMSKPTGDEADGTWTTAQIKMLWHFFEQSHRKAKQNATQADRYTKMMRIGNGAEAPAGSSDHDEPEEHSGFATKRQKRGKGAGVSGSGPMLMPENIPDGSGLPKQVWRTRTLPEALLNLWKGRYFLQIVDATRDRNNNPYTIPLGKNGSYMGAFPHAICYEAQRGRESSSAQEPCYYCSESNNITIEVQLTQRRENGNAFVDASECALIERLKSEFREDERQNWGYYESSFGVHLQLEFAEEPREEGAAEDLLINPYHSSAGCAFKKALQGNKLLVPFESEMLYSTSHYEASTEGGRVAFKKFKLNTGTSSSKLVPRYKNRKYQFVARVTNPFFAGVVEPARSVPFKVKSVFYNDLKRDERFVRMPDGDVVASPAEDVPF